ncbi:unnamed protein product [Trypanosoma congolense IL3000]|uniref:WGS project CAEQ00000000 data, annotated contig 933 n=1 Tax=Trypanosoma congolense (strain IL3000) TaxID=1068625 RepID=F9WJN8_TRYCI|nr:unnamed protein product [Trypanosoma congolense IL3000]
MHKTVCNSSRVIEKIRIIITETFWNDLAERKGVSAMILESLMARLIMASGVLGIDLFNYHFCIKTIRRHLNVLIQTRWDYPITLQQSTIRTLKRWVFHCLANKPQHPMRPYDIHSTYFRRYTICTDASMSGWGGIVYDNHTGGLSTYGGHWRRRTPSADIAELEALALLHTWKSWRVTLDPSFRRLSLAHVDEDSPTRDVVDGVPLEPTIHIRFMVDSTVLFWALTKRASRNHLVWRAIRPLLRNIATLATKTTITYTTSYVNSSNNSADELSRLRPLDTGKVYRSIIANNELGKEPVGMTWLDERYNPS